MNIESHSFVFG